MIHIGLSWQLSSFTGWGQFGIQATTRMITSGRVVPVLLCDGNAESEIVVDPLQQALLLPVMQASERYRRELSEMGDGLLDFDVLVALGDDLGIAAPYVRRGRQEVGIVFLEGSSLSPGGVERGRQYRRLIAGSSWAAEVLRAHGLDHVATVLQGIDPRLFRPSSRIGLLPGRFTIFSGGKLEYRKGQDIVVAAFRKFRERRPDALLAVAWQNLWPATAAGVADAGHVTAPGIDGKGRVDVGRWLVDNGVPENAFVALEMKPNALLAPVMAEVDAAVFASRCEGGTNLMAMEAMAAGVPTILSANTGHLDLIGADTCFPLQHQRPVAAKSSLGTEGWGESDVDEMVAAFERIYSDREEARRRGKLGAALLAPMTWPAQIDRLLAEVGVEAA